MEAYFNHHKLSIQHSKDYIRSRYITTDQFIKKGAVIITSQPLGTVPLPQSNHEFCNYCFRKQVSPPLQHCSQCKKVYFCDMICFKNAWLSYHQFVCKKTKITHRNAENDMDLEMLERVALNISRYRKNTIKQPITNNAEESVQATVEAFFSLAGHDQSQQQHIKEKHKLFASEVLKKPFIKDTDIKHEELTHFLNVFKSNNFTITDINLEALGEGSYPIASLFNHSCRPNAFIMFDGVLASIQAIQDIEPNTEITLAYVDVAHDRNSRQQVLREKYLFTCQCERCRLSSDRPYLSLIDTLLEKQSTLSDKPYAEIRESLAKEIEEWDLLQMCRLYDRKNDGCPDHNKPLTLANYTHYFIQFFAPYLLTWDQLELHQQSVGNKFKTCLSDFDDPIPSLAQPRVQATYDAIMSAAIDKMLSYPTDPATTMVPYSLSTLSHCTRLFYEEMDDGHWRNAVKLGMYILIQYCLIYPPYHPMVAKHYLMLAKACWNSVVLSELITDDLVLEKVYERGVRRWIMSSKETVAVAFGKHTNLWRETLELEWIFLREQKLK